MNQHKVLINAIEDRSIPLINKVKQELGKHFNLDESIYVQQAPEQKKDNPARTNGESLSPHSTAPKPLEQMEVDDLFK